MKAESRLFVDIVDAIRDDHTAAATANIESPEIIDELVKAINYECAKLAAFLSAAQIIEEISPKSKDVIMGTGERLSCMFMTALLQDIVSGSSNRGACGGLKLTVAMG